MKNLIKNKRADARWLSPWMIINWVLIIGVLILISYMFFSRQGDVRAKESQVLNTKLVDCISRGFSLEDIKKTDFNVYNKCYLNEDLFDKQQIYYFDISIEDNSAKQVLGLTGGVNWKTECAYQIQKGGTETKLPQCQSTNIFVKDVKTGITYKLVITTGSNQNGMA